MDYPVGNRISGVMLVAAMLVAGLSGSRAQAAFVSEGSGSTLTYSDEYVATSSTYSTATGSDYLLAVPGQYVIGNTFSAPQAYVLGTSSVGSYAFQDSYVFQVGAGASGDVLTASLSLPPLFQLTNVQFRLYEITAGTTTPVVGGSLTGNPVVSVLTGWYGQSGVESGAISKSFTGLQTTGTYVLDIAGTATGSGGGLYTGALNLQPVPVPATIWLMLSGVGALVATARKRKIA